MIAMAGRGVVVQPAAPEAARGWAGLGSVSSHLTMHAHCQVEVVRGWIPGMLPGSVSQVMVDHAPCPVAVIRPE